MKVYVFVAIIIVVASGLVVGVLQSVQPSKKWTAAEIVAKAKPGQWVEVKGIVQPDLSVQTLEIRILSNGLGNDDWELEAKVLAVTPAKSEFQILSLPVKVMKATKLNNPIKRIDDVKPEMLIKLEGTYLSDGTFQAKDVENTTAKLKDKPQLAAMIEAVGKIGQVDEAKHMITVMGIQFHIAEKTDGWPPI